jgi:uncharacterized membrane protein
MFGLEHGRRLAESIAVQVDADIRRKAQRQDPFRHETQVHDGRRAAGRRRHRPRHVTPRLRHFPVNIPAGCVAHPQATGARRATNRSVMLKLQEIIE